MGRLDFFGCPSDAPAPHLDQIAPTRLRINEAAAIVAHDAAGGSTPSGVIHDDAVALRLAGYWSHRPT
jgi:hypothetical protein